MPQESAEPSASRPTASAFPNGNTEQGLKEIRTRLLDLTNRNKLLNFRFPTGSCLRFVDVNSDAAYNRIMDGGRLSISAVPEPPRIADKPTPLSHAKELGRNVSFDLDDPFPAEEYDGQLPVLHYAEHLNTLVRKIDDAARTAVEESGANMLYLSFGFLEWYESDDSDEPRFAPLVSIPVTLDRSPGKGKSFRCELEYSGEDFSGNLSLVEKMRRDMGLDVPMLDEDESPEQYFRRFSDLLSIKQRWRIRQQMTLSLLDFGKLLMFRDLDPKNWPADDSISNHQLVRELFEGTHADEIVRGEEFAIDDPALQAELPALICDADSSQHSALIDALRGKNLVIEGPPGTGKSQTISNLIAEALAKGKTILFVSDKLAALQVVRDRLEERGLGAFCLELHSHRTQKGALLKDVGRRIELSGSFSDPANFDGLLSVAENRKATLIEYVTMIKQVISPIQKTVFDILWAREAAFQALPIDAHLVSDITPTSLLEYSASKLAEAKDWLAIYTRNLVDVLVGCNNVHRHPWCWMQRALSYEDEQTCVTLLREIVRAVENADRITVALNEIPISAISKSSEIEDFWPGESVRYLVDLFRVLEETPSGLLDSRSPTLEDQESIERLRMVANDARKLQAESERLAKRFDLKISQSELAQHASVIEQSAWPARWFSGEYRRAVRAYLAIAVNHKRATRPEMSEALRSVASLVSRRLEFDTNKGHHDLIGPGFIGVDSNWELLLRLADWYQKVLTAFPNPAPVASAFRVAFFSENTAKLRELKARIPGLREERAKLVDVVERLSTVSSVLEDFHRSTGDLPPTATLPTCERITHLYKNAVRELATVYRGSGSTGGPIENAIHLIEVLSQRCGPAECVTDLMRADTERHLADARASLAELADAMKVIVKIAAKLSDLSQSELWRKAAAESLGEWQAAAVKALGAQDSLQDWLNLIRCRNEGEPYGLATLAGLADVGLIKPEQLALGFDFVFYNTVAKHVMTRSPALWEFSGDSQETIRQQFARTDREVIVLQRKRTAARAANRKVHPGTKGVHVKDWTELALLRREVEKQKRHIPIRELIRRAGASLQALKPCFMMGPQSVAKYLAPCVLKFDLVVMDEASQIRPEDAIGALARGGQAVIVGDPMQLPPTSFFNRVAPTDGDDGDGAQSIAADSESILDVASAVYPSVRRLRWHYRSQHESLIAFSNQAFYGDLIVFPHAQRNSETMGVKYRLISGAVYEDRRNAKEAAAVVDAVLDHMKKYPTESLGVVTMNFEQRELIEGLLEERLHDDPFAQSFRASMTGTKIFFVKNLENVQGDERDVIFISTTYGPDATGSQFQRFGPVNSEAGHRRLNVLFTRSKLRTVVFTSLDIDKILTTPDSSRGLRAFKGYLQFARTGILETAESTSGQEINDFERSVRAVIEARNYETVPQVGVAGFFIDLAVKNPKKPGGFLLGIECDGATYHSSKSARDRDRLREEILRSRGWTLHRIWSTDWFKNRSKEIDKMFKRIESMVDGPAN